MPEGDRIEEYSAHYGNDYLALAWVLLLPLAVGLVLLVSYPEVPKFVFVAAAMALSAGGLLVWLFVAKIVKTEWGSFVDLRNKQIVWWEGPSPAARTVVNISALAKLVIVIDPYHRCEVYLDRIEGERLRLPDRCVRKSCVWAESLRAAFPGLPVEETDWSTFHGRPWPSGD
ncbi:hypothetical protein [Taklimakanibacter lacteus]|uniref:hypothetical protein n=1 Tax=Taklimakanibacter lacteus TaxID=2268456 RepID=UPI000E672E85